MKKFFAVFFIILGVIFFIILLLLAYLFIIDPYNIKPSIFNNEVNPTKSVNTDNASLGTENTNGTAAEVDKAPNLSPAQEKALETVGIDPAAVPQSFTAEQLSCFEAVLGKARVDEIKAGDTPSATEFFKAKACI